MSRPTPSVRRPQRVVSKAFYDDRALVSGPDVWSWSRWGLTPYAFRSSAERLDLGWAATLTLAKLRQGRLHVKSRSVSSEAGGLAGWRDRRDQHVERYAVPGAGWAEHQGGAQTRMLARQRWQREVVAGFQLGTRTPWEQARSGLLDALGDREAGEAALRRWLPQADAALATLSRGAFAAQALPAVELRNLRKSSVFRGLTPPPLSVTGRRFFGPAEVADEFQGTEVYPTVVPTPRGLRTVLRVVAPDGSVRFTAAWVLAGFPLRMPFPGTPPWLAHHDRLPFPVELDAFLELVPPRRALKAVKRRLDLARDQEREAEFARVDLPLETEEMIRLAREWEYQIPNRSLPDVHGWVVLRADAASAEELEGLFGAARDLYEDLRIDLAWPGGMSQMDLYLQSVPGERWRFRSFRQRWAIETVGCGMVHAGSGLAHPTGLYAGVTTGRARQVVTWDPHHAITRTREQGERHVEGQGGTVLLGAMRAGKSAAVGTVVHDYALAGFPTVLIDFGGMQDQLAHVPDIEGRVAVLDLMSAGAGSADTMTAAVVPGEWSDPRVAAARKMLTRDTLQTLAWAHLAQSPAAGTALREAITAVAGSAAPSTAGVLGVLQSSPAGSAARDLGSFLAFELDALESDLLIGEGAGFVPVPLAPLSILTGRGLVLPEGGKPIVEWDTGERFGAAVFGIAAWKARQLLWGLPRDLLKLLAIDEAHVALAAPAGRKVISDALRNGPKYGVATMLATHNAGAVADPRIANGVSTWMQFRSTSEDELREALRLQGVEATAKVMDMVRRFENGECLITMPGGERDRMRWDQWEPQLRAALNTTAGKATA